MNSPLILRELELSDEKAFLEGLNEWPENQRTWHSLDWGPGMTFSELIERHEKNKAGLDLPGNFVPSTALYGFVGSIIIGRLHIRHSLNDFLRERGGHIGYAVIEKYRGQGFAKEMLRQSAPFCRAIGIRTALITCDDFNMQSIRVIEANGGRLVDKVYDVTTQNWFRRYHLNFS